MVKLIAMIAAFIVCTFIGNTSASRLKYRADGIDELHCVVRDIAAQMRFQRKTLPELVRQVSIQRECVLWKVLAEQLLYCGFSDAWTTAVKIARETDKKIMFLKIPELSVMQNLAHELGRSDLATQQRQLKFTENALEEIHSAACEEQQRCTKLYRTLGISAGITCAIVIW